MPLLASDVILGMCDTQGHCRLIGTSLKMESALRIPAPEQGKDEGVGPHGIMTGVHVNTEPTLTLDFLGYESRTVLTVLAN